MKFKIYNMENQLEDEEIELYKKAGLEIIESEGTLFGRKTKYREVKETEKEFNTLEELMDFIKTIDCKIVVYGDNQITIYDDYLE